MYVCACVCQVYRKIKIVCDDFVANGHVLSLNSKYFYFCIFKSGFGTEMRCTFFQKMGIWVSRACNLKDIVSFALMKLLEI